MKFRRSSNYHLVSECGQYTIAKVIVASQVQYEAWHLPDGKGPGRLLAGGKSSSLDCIQACRKHGEPPIEKQAS